MDKIEQLKKKNLISAIMSTVLTLAAIIIAYQPVILYVYISIVVILGVLSFILPKKYPKVYFLIVLPLYVFIQILLAIILIVL